MASLPITFSPAGGRGFEFTAAKSAGKPKKKKSILDWKLGGFEKDQLLETDPVLQKVEGKGRVRGGQENSVQLPPNSDGGSGGLIAKKD